MHKNTLRLSMAALIYILSAICTQAIAESYAIIGNASNSVTSESAKQQIKRLYLKQQKKWRSGATATVFDRGEGTMEDKIFRERVLDMDPSACSNHWLSIKQKTGETPPRTIKSTRTLLKLVSRFEGSFGVVNQKEIATLPEGVRVLLAF